MTAGARYVGCVIRRAFPFLAATLLVACGGTTDPSTAPAVDTTTAATPGTTAPSTNTPSTNTPSTNAPETGDATNAAVPEALQFSAPLVGGGEIELGELAGRPVLLWFWAPW